MTPDIALELDHEVIRLLRRRDDGEDELGRVALDDAAFVDKLARLRAAAGPAPVPAEVRLPASLVLFLEARDADDLSARVAESTSCPVEELCLGRVGRTGAAVEWTTLDEARDFAEAHGFEPAAFTARSGTGETVAFRTEPAATPTFRSHRPAQAEPRVRSAAPPSLLAEADAEGPNGGTVQGARDSTPDDRPSVTNAGDTTATRQAVAPPAPAPPPATGSATLPGAAPETPARTAPAEGAVPAVSQPVADAAQHSAKTTAPTADAERGVAASPALMPSPLVAATPPSRAPAAPRVQAADGPRPPSKPPVPIVASPAAPARSEAEALTVFGARERETRSRGFTPLHAVAAVLAAGVAFAALSLLDDTPEEVALVEDGTRMAAPIDPAAESFDLEGDAAAALDPEAEVAALDPATAPAPAAPATQDAAEAPPPRVEAAQPASETPQSELGTEPPVPAETALEESGTVTALAAPGEPPTAPSVSFTPPPPAGTVFEMDEDGLVVPTEDGALTPKGVIVHSGPPPVLPPDRGGEQQTVTEDDAGLAVPEVEARAITRLSPPPRPASVQRPVIVASPAGDDTPRPRLRPTSVGEVAVAALGAANDPDFDALAEQARAQTSAATTGLAATRAAEPPPPTPDAPAAAQQGQPNVAVQPSLPTRASVADRATVANAMEMNRVNLIGVYGSPSDRRALIRLPTGRYLKVQVGDRLDGGRVAAIQSSSLEYVKGGRRYALSMPRG